MSQEYSSPLLLETIKIAEGEIANLPYHQDRCDQSRQILFQSTDRLDLASFIQPPQTGLYRCRILYGEKLHSIKYIPYLPKEINSLKIVPSNIDYALKYANRDTLNTLLESNKEVDEVIIEKEGTEKFQEGCLSVPGFYEDIERFKYVKVEYSDRDGNKQTVESDAFLAVAIQHEMDHLDGKLFVEKLSILKRKKFEKEWKRKQKEGRV